MFTTFEVEQGAITLQVTINEALDFNQTYDNLGGSQILRMMNGAAVKQNHWAKLSTTISCSGVIPPALYEIDFRDQYLMRCGAKRSSSSVNPTVQIPLERRSDAGYEVKGYALVVDSEGRHTWVASPTTDGGTDAFITPVPGTTLYRAYYWPEFFVFSDAPSETNNVHQADFSWTLTAEQV